MSDRLGLVAASLALCSSFALLACDPETDDESLDAQPFVDGVAKDTQGDAFRVVLTSRDGAMLPQRRSCPCAPSGRTIDFSSVHPHPGQKPDT